MSLVAEAARLVTGSGTAAMTVRIVLILAGTVAVVRIFDRMLAHRFRRASRHVEMEETSYRLLRRLVNVGIYILGIGVAVYTVPQLRQLSYALFASAGFIGIVVGFAAQEALGNIIAGIFIVLFDPFEVDNNIETQQHYGTVEDITLRQTIIRTPSNERVVVPNAKILDDYIINYSKDETRSRYEVQFAVSYDEDVDAVREIMLEAADGHELTETGESEVILKDLDDSAMILELRIWAEDRPTVWRAGQELREGIKKRFDEEGVTIPFPQRTIHRVDGA